MRGEARAVDHDGQARRLRLRRQQVEERRHRLLGIEQVGVHVDVEQVRAPAHLLERDGDRALEVVRLDQAPEARRPGDVRPLADDDEPRVRTDDERIQPGEPRLPRALRNPPGRQTLDRPGDRMRVLGRRSAAAADQVHEAVLRERAQVAARIGRLLVVQAERIREPSIRMTGHVRRGHAREALEERPHLGGAERAVHPDDERLRLLDRDPERIGRLTGEVAAALVDGGEREPERKLRRRGSSCHDRSLCVQRVEDGLDQQEVDTAVAERAHLLLVRGLHLLEGHRAIGRIVDLRRERERDVQRADGACDESRLVGRACRPLVRCGPSESRAREAHLRGCILQCVIRLPDRRRGERVGRRDVRAGLEIGVVDPRDDLGRGQVEEIGITFDVVRVLAKLLAPVLLLREPAAMDEHTPGPVEDHDSLGEELFHMCTGVLHEFGSRLKSREPEKALWLFRRLVTRSPSCRSKLSGVLRLANTHTRDQLLPAR